MNYHTVEHRDGNEGVYTSDSATDLPLFVSRPHVSLRINIQAIENAIENLNHRTTFCIDKISNKTIEQWPLVTFLWMLSSVYNII